VQISKDEASEYENDDEKYYEKVNKSSIVIFLQIIIIYLLQILLLLRIVIKHLYDLAFVNWYDFQLNRYKFNYPYLKRTNKFMLIPIEEIDNIVHIVKHFCSQNSYFVNYHLF